MRIDEKEADSDEILVARLIIEMIREAKYMHYRVHRKLQQPACRMAKVRVRGHSTV